uniref:Hemoglobin subunit alpha-like n=1 Tax=Sinocyclocheilus rhinocerous TaxID=307959 RepID=A0A673K0T0_9TELE
MSLSANDKATVKALWAKISPKAEDIGNEALSRMLYVYPQTKTYFSHWSDLSPGVAVDSHSKMILTLQLMFCDFFILLAIAITVSIINNTFELILYLINLFFQLRVDPVNFRILSHNILVVLAMLFPDDFTPEAHLAMDKFLVRLALALSDKYR